MGRARRWLLTATAIVGGAAWWGLAPPPATVGQVGEAAWPGRAEGDVFDQLRSDYLREVAPILASRCYACHTSNRFAKQLPLVTRWSDSARTMVDNDILLGRKSLDLSDGFPFTRDGKWNLTIQADLLAKLEVVVRDGTMPPLRFLAAHPSARLSPDDAATVAAWASAAQSRLTGQTAISGPAGDVSRRLNKSCGGCHGPQRTLDGPEVSDLADVIAQGWVVPGDGDGSKLLQVITSGDMPPSGGAPALLEAALRAWITAGAPVEETVPPALSRDALLAAVRYDLERLPVGNRRFVRYFSAEHLERVRSSPGEAARAADALRLVMSSFSRTPSAAPVTLVCGTVAVWRVDLGVIGLSPAALRVVEDGYPLNWEPVGAAGEDAAAIARATGAEVTVMALDWFIRMATLPPLYPALARTPDRLAELAEEQGIDLCSLEEGPQRAALERSGVSQFHRAVERRETSSGSLWISYDFNSRSGEADLFSFPLGPPCLGGSQGFEAAGNEVIYSLPNGLLAFALFDRRGRRLDVDAPQAIVQDGARAISNALSCMKCHAGGLLPAEDDLRARHQALLSDARTDDLYADPTHLKFLLEQDNEAFAAAVLRAGVSPLHAAPPVNVVAARFEADVTLGEVAGLLGVSDESLSDTLQALPADHPLRPLVTTGRASRESLLERFSDLVLLGRFGRPLPAREPLPFDDEARRARLVIPDAVSSSTGYRLRPISGPDGPLLVGVTEVTQAQWGAAMDTEAPLGCAREAVARTNGALAPSGAELPAICVTFRDAIRLANRMSIRDGLEPAYVLRDNDVLSREESNGYRLPTPAEWDAAAGGGRFAGAEDLTEVCAIGNLLTATDERALQGGATHGDAPDTATFSCTDGFAGLAPVGSFDETEDGLLDLTGNAGEWIWRGGVARPVLLSDAQLWRGGSWRDGPETGTLRAEHRVAGDEPLDHVGVRLIRRVETQDR